MLVHAHSGGFGYGYGFGAAALTQGKDFNCNSAICFAIGKANDELFKSLQMKLNVLSKIGGFAPLVVDGFIGTKTVAALQSLQKVGFANPPGTKEGVAQTAPTIISILDGIATVQKTTAVAAGQSSPLAPTGTPVTFQPTPAIPSPAAITTTAQLPAPPPATAALPLPKSKKTLFLIAGGLAAVLVVGGVGYAVYRRRSA